MAGLRISAARPIRHRPTPPRAHAPQRGEGPARARRARADARRIRREQRAMGPPVPAVGHRSEGRMPAEFGPPPDVKPAHELFGEMLLEAGRAAEAQREFARALALAPKRALSLLGLGRAAAAAGDRATAAQAYREVREIWHRADPGLPGLAEASRSVGAP